MTILQSLKVTAHFICSPTGIAGESGDVVPVVIMRINENHSVVCRTSAKSAGTRIENTIYRHPFVCLKIFRIALLKLRLGEVSNKEIPPHCLVFGRESMKGGNIVVFWQAVRFGVQCIPTH